MPKIKVKRFKQESAHREMDTHGRYQTYYRPCYAVDKNWKKMQMLKENPIKTIRNQLLGKSV